MGSKVQPYFILTAEKVVDPREADRLEQQLLHEQLNKRALFPTPAPPPSSNSALYPGLASATEFPILVLNKSKNKKKRKVKYKITVKEVRKKGPMNKRMQMIKEKLEKSREMMNNQKVKDAEPDLKCENSKPQVKTDEVPEYGDITKPLFKLDRSVSDMGPNALVKTRRDGPGPSPFVYFVVSEETIEDTSLLVNEDGDKLVFSKSADKRRRLRTVEDNRMKRDRCGQLSQSAKMRNLAREVGLKTNVSKSLDEQKDGKFFSRNMPVINEIVFSGPEFEASPTKKTNNRRVMRSAHSPPKIPPGTPATTIHTSPSEIPEENEFDADETVPRKPFLSGPMYTGKAKGLHSVTLGTFELPTITAEQKRRALGLGTRFEEFSGATNRNSVDSKNRKVSFADQLPVIRGNGFISETDGGSEMPSLGSRAHTMGSITLPSEQAEKQMMCQRYQAPGVVNNGGGRSRGRGCIPLPLSKIDIVSNVYDEMIVKMIQEYLHDTNTPTRQSQLARELLVHLQKHNENMKELNVPNLDGSRQRMRHKEMMKHKKKAQQLINDISLSAPPNTAEDLKPKTLTPLFTGVPEIPLNQLGPAGMDDDQPQTAGSTENTPKEETVPFVQITFKNRPDDDTGKSGADDAQPSRLGDKSRSDVNSKQSHRPILTPVVVTSFQMAPPGLSKDDTYISMTSKV